MSSGSKRLPATVASLMYSVGDALTMASACVLIQSSRTVSIEESVILLFTSEILFLRLRKKSIWGGLRAIYINREGWGEGGGLKELTAKGLGGSHAGGRMRTRDAVHMVAALPELVQQTGRKAPFPVVRVHHELRDPTDRRRVLVLPAASECVPGQDTVDSHPYVRGPVAPGQALRPESCRAEADGVPFGRSSARGVEKKRLQRAQRAQTGLRENTHLFGRLGGPTTVMLVE